MRLFLLLVLLTPLLPGLELPSLQTRNYSIVEYRNGTTEIGEITSIDDGTLTFLKSGDTVARKLQPNQYTGYELPITAAEVVERRSEVLLGVAADENVSLELWETIDFATKNELHDAARMLATAAVERYPTDLRLADRALDLIGDDPDSNERRRSIAEACLAVDQTWSRGYEVLAEMAYAAGDADTCFAVVSRWLSWHPANYRANVLMAEMAEQRGDLGNAREAHRKAMEYHKDEKSAADYARLSLLVGDFDAALNAATKSGAAADARAIEGIVNVVKGSYETGQGLIEEALILGELETELAQLARYNLGVALYNLGNHAAALDEWRSLSTPAAALALAIAQRTPVVVARVPEQLKAIAREHNACLALESQSFEAARKQLEGGISQRNQFLGHVASVLESKGSKESIRVLKLTDTRESKHWQIYGHLISGRLDEAQKLLDALPQDDGYAAVCRVYVAEAMGDSERAARLFGALSSASDLPRDYVNKLVVQYENRDDELLRYDFDWPDGYALSKGWAAKSTGTGIDVRIADGDLVMSGTQAASTDPVSRAWCLFRPGELRRVTASLDVQDIGDAMVGIEVTNEQRVNGISYGVNSAGELSWRLLSDGRYGAWKPLTIGVEPGAGAVSLSLAYDPRSGRLTAVVGEEHHEIGKGVRLSGAYVAAGVFGEAPTGVSWRLTAKEVVVQLRKQDQGL